MNESGGALTNTKLMFDGGATSPAFGGCMDDLKARSVYGKGSGLHMPEC